MPVVLRIVPEAIVAAMRDPNAYPCCSPQPSRLRTTSPGRFAAWAKIDQLQEQSVAACLTIRDRSSHSSKAKFSRREIARRQPDQLLLILCRPTRSATLKS